MIKTIKIEGVPHYDSILLAKEVGQTHQSLKSKFDQVGYQETQPKDWFGNGCAIPRPVALTLLKRYDISKMQNGSKQNLQQMLDHLNGVKPKSEQELIEVKAQLKRMEHQLNEARKGGKVDLTGIESQLNSISKRLIENEGGLDSVRADLIDSNNTIKLRLNGVNKLTKLIKSETDKDIDDLIEGSTQLNQLLGKQMNRLTELNERFDLCIQENIKEKEVVIVERDRLAAEAAKYNGFEGILNRVGNMISIFFSSFMVVMLAYLVAIGIEAKLQADTVMMFGAEIDWNGLFTLMLVVQVVFVVVNGNKRFFVYKYRNGDEETKGTMIIAAAVFGCYNFSMNIFRFFYQKEVEWWSMEFWFYIQISLVLSLAISILGYVVAKRTVYSD